MRFLWSVRDKYRKKERMHALNVYSFFMLIITIRTDIIRKLICKVINSVLEISEGYKNISIISLYRRGDTFFYQMTRLSLRSEIYMILWMIQIAVEKG